MCFHDVGAVIEPDARARRRMHERPPPRFTGLDDILQRCYIAACSPLIRSSVIKPLPAWFTELPVGDWQLYVMAAEKGWIGFLPEVMAVYRVHPEGFWNSMDKVAQCELLLSFYAALDRATAGRLHRRAWRAAGGWHYKLARELNRRRQFAGAARRACQALVRGPRGEDIDWRLLLKDPDPETMQIEVVDDHSTTDDPESVVRELGGDRVSFLRHSENVGHRRHFDCCLTRARGHLVHILHVDDLVRDGFYRTMARPFDAHSELGAAFCRHQVIDERGVLHLTSVLEREESGVLDDLIERIATGQRLHTPSIIVRRTVYERLGGFNARLTWTEDWEMWVRIAAFYPVWYEVAPLAVYRVHTASSSGWLSRSAETIRAVRRAIPVNREVLPPDRADALSRQAMRNCARTALRRARRMIRAGELEGARAHILEATRTLRSLPILAGAAQALAYWWAKRLLSEARA